MQLDQDLTNFFLEKDGQKEAWLDSLEAVIALPWEGMGAGSTHNLSTPSGSSPALTHLDQHSHLLGLPAPAFPSHSLLPQRRQRAPVSLWAIQVHLLFRTLHDSHLTQTKSQSPPQGPQGPERSADHLLALPVSCPLPPSLCSCHTSFLAPAQTYLAPPCALSLSCLVGSIHLSLYSWD